MALSSDPSTSEIYRALSAHDHSPAALSRRRFIQGALALGGAGLIGNSLFADSAWAGPPLGADDRILVTIMMGGGNDGLSMLEPLDDGHFMSTRGGLAGDPATSHALDDGSGLYFHERLPGIKALYDQGRVACVMGVGNSLDDHSHFTSMATWMAGRFGALPTSGWLGRYGQGASFDELGMLSIGYSGIPLHLRTPGFIATGVSPDGQMYGTSQDTIDLSQYDYVQKNAASASGEQWLDAVANTFSGSIDVARMLAPAYPVSSTDNGVIRDMEVAAEVINLDIGARVLGVGYGDFDHHSGQNYPQGERMGELDAAISLFFATLDPAFADRVTVMTFSEFGRSFTPNGSAGTDHGTASTMMVIGDAVNGGLYGEMPSLTNLDNIGDLHHTVDFRSYYASILDGWLGADSNQILSGNFEDLNLFQQDPGGGAPSFSAPIAGSMLDCGDIALNWTSGTDEYWVYAGRSVGDKTYFDSGSLGSATSTIVTGLPADGSTVHVRLWHRPTNGDWATVDATFTACSSLSASMASPPAGSTLDCGGVGFSWNGTANEYWVYAGSSNGASDYYDSGSLGAARSTTVTGLPVGGSTVYVRLWYRSTGGTWQTTDSTYIACGSVGATINSPSPGSTLDCGSDNFAWGGSADEYWLYAGSSQGERDYYNSGAIGGATSATVTGLPSDGSTVHVRLWYRPAGGSWQSSDVTYTACSNAVSASISAPAAGAAVCSGNAMTWSGNADEYWVYLGSSAGQSNYFDSGSLGGASSVALAGMPQKGTQVHARLFYRSAGGQWMSRDRQYTAC